MPPPDTLARPFLAVSECARDQRLGGFSEIASVVSPTRIGLTGLGQIGAVTATTRGGAIFQQVDKAARQLLDPSRKHHHLRDGQTKGGSP